MKTLDDIVYTRRRLKRGETLYRAGSEFESLYTVRSGFLKSCMALEDGRDRVTGFHMAGETLGLDAIGSGSHTTDLMALEDSEVCVIPYARLDEPHLQRQLHRLMSREIVRGQGVTMLLGTMRAEERLAAFLCDLSRRFLERGYASNEFHLRMTREEIGSYLGLSLETVSRLFSRFQDERLVGVRQKHVRILDPDGLRAMMGRVAGHEPGELRRIRPAAATPNTRNSAYGDPGVERTLRDLGEPRRVVVDAQRRLADRRAA